MGLTVMFLMIFCFVWIVSAEAHARAFLPLNEQMILLDVADEYGLSDQETDLLFTIRKIENGGSGREMGVMLKEAQRYAGDFEASLRLQAQYAAGTIKKRYTGDLALFASRWCPDHIHDTNKNWLPNARFWMERMGWAV